MFKLSKYNILKKLNSENYIMYNTFTNNFFIMNKIQKENLLNLKLSKKEKNEMLDKGFLINSNFDEKAELKNERLKETFDEEYLHYTIYTTYTCNANCFYCFERNKKKEIMSIKTANDIAEFIINNIKNKTKRVHIQWFGGEPLLNIKIIDLISEKIKKYIKNKDIKFTSNIVTNGSLINKDMIQKFKKWNVVNIQITLDGTKKEYEKRKAYTKIKNSFDLVINNIEEILKSNLQVSVRINFDKQNFEDILNLLVFLSKFNEYNNFRCYLMPLYSTSKYNKENYIDEKNCSIFFGKIFSKMIELKYIKNQKYFLLKRIPLFCKALKKSAWVIDTKGNLYKCTHDMEKEIGSIYNKKVDGLENWERFRVNKVCDDCIFLPLCQGGCNCLKNENSCGNRCFIYKYCFDEVLNSILKLNNIPYKIRRNKNECSCK